MVKQVWYFVSAVACMVSAAACFRHSKFMKKFPDTEYVTATLLFGVYGVVGVLTLMRWSLARCGCRRRWMRCLLKVLAYTASAGVFLFTFKIGAKAEFANHLNETITTIKEQLSHHSIKNTEFQHTADDIIRKLDWQFTNADNILFLDVPTLFSALFLSGAFLCIGRVLDNQSAFMDWLFDLMCDLVVHMAVDVFGKKWGYGLCFFLLAVVLVAFKEWTEPVEENRRNERRDNLPVAVGRP